MSRKQAENSAIPRTVAASLGFVDDTNERYRQLALMLVKRGIQQKALAVAMGMSEGGFSKWMNSNPSMGPISVRAMDGFNAYVADLTTTLEQETQRAEASAGETFCRDSAGDRRAHHGPPPTGTEERRKTARA